MYFPIVIKWTSPFPILGLLGGISIFMQISKEPSVSKQWRTWSDARFCSVWSGFALFVYVHKKDTRQDPWVKTML